MWVDTVSFIEWLQDLGYTVLDEEDIRTTFDEYEVEEMYGRYRDDMRGSDGNSKRC